MMKSGASLLQMEKGDLRAPVFCALGLAFSTAGIWCDMLAGVAQADADSAVIAHLPQVVFAVACFICAATYRRAGRMEIHPVAFLIIGLLAAIGRLLGFFGGLIGGQVFPVYAGIVLYSACEALLILFWIERLTHLGPLFTRTALPMAYLLVACMYFVLTALDARAISLAISTFPLISGALLAYCPRHDGVRREEEDVAPEPHVAWSFPIYPVVLVFIYKFVFYASLPFTSGHTSYGPLGMILAAVFALIGTTFFFDRYSPRLLYKLALPLICAGLLMLGWLNVGSGAATLLSNAGNIGMELFILMSLTEVCFNYSIDGLWMFGIIEGFGAAAFLLGQMAGNVFVSRFPVGSPEADATIAVTVIVLMVISVLFFNDDMVDRTFGTEPVRIHNADGTTETGVPTVMTYYEELVWRCSVVARRYGLTHREEDVLELLAQGMSVARIEQELSITESTSKTHVHHIYEKLGVHSRDEARAIVDGVKRQ